jgi:hypothetical protein
MRGLSRLFLYLVYFFQAETKALRKEAYDSAVVRFRKRPVRSASNPYPRVSEYNYRREEFRAHQRAYINAKCDQVAKEKLALRYSR